MTPDQEQKLEYSATELFEYVDEIKIIKDLFDSLPTKKDIAIASPYLNFRDALFHYNKMYEAAKEDNNESFFQQYACIEEHLNRGLKDFAIHLFSNYYIKIIHKIIKQLESSNDRSALPRVRHIYHNMKNLVIEIRLEGQTLRHFVDHKNVWLSTFVDDIEEFDKILGDYPLIKQLFDDFSKGMPQQKQR